MNNNDAKEISRMENIEASNGSFLKSALKLKNNIVAGVKNVCSGLFYNTQLKNGPEIHRGNTDNIQSALPSNAYTLSLKISQGFADRLSYSGKSDNVDSKNIINSHDFNFKAPARRNGSFNGIHTSNINWFSTNIYPHEPQASPVRCALEESYISKKNVLLPHSSHYIKGSSNSLKHENFLKNNIASTSNSEISLNSDRLNTKQDRFSDCSNASNKTAVFDLGLTDDWDMKDITCLPPVVLNHGNQQNDECEWIPSVKSKSIRQMDKPSNDVDVIESDLSSYSTNGIKFDNESERSSEHYENCTSSVLVNPIPRFAFNSEASHRAKEIDKNKNINETVDLRTVHTSGDITLENRILQDLQYEGGSSADFAISKQSNELRCSGFQFEQKVSETTGKKFHPNEQNKYINFLSNLVQPSSCYISTSLPEIPYVLSECASKEFKNRSEMINNNDAKHPVNDFNETHTQISQFSAKRPTSSDFCFFHKEEKRFKFDGNSNSIVDERSTQTPFDIIIENEFAHDLQDKGESIKDFIISKESNELRYNESQFGQILNETTGKQIYSSDQDKCSNFQSNLGSSCTKISSLPSFLQKPFIQSAPVSKVTENHLAINNSNHPLNNFNATHKEQSPLFVKRSTSSGFSLFQNEKDRPKISDTENQNKSLSILHRNNIPLELDVVMKDISRDNGTVFCVLRDLKSQNMNHGEKESLPLASILDTNSSRNCVTRMQIDSGDISKNRKLTFPKNRLVKSSSNRKEAEQEVKGAKKYETEKSMPLILRRPLRKTKSCNFSVVHGCKRQTNELNIHGRLSNVSGKDKFSKNFSYNSRSPKDVPNIDEFSLKEQVDLNPPISLPSAATNSNLDKKCTPDSFYSSDNHSHCCK